MRGVCGFGAGWGRCARKGSFLHLPGQNGEIQVAYKKCLHIWCLRVARDVPKARAADDAEAIRGEA